MTMNETQDETHRMEETIRSHSKKLEDDLKKLGLKIKHHEDNLKFLKTHTNDLDDSILDMQVILRKYHSSSQSKAGSQNLNHAQSEQSTIEQILRQEKTAAGIFCQLKLRNATPGSRLTKDVLGVVATLGRVEDDNLSRLLSEYLGLEAMLAIVCKSYEGVKALEMYDKEGRVDKNAGLHGLGPSIGRPMDGRFLVICLEDLRPYAGDLVAEDPQKSLALLKPRLPSGECPPGFLGFAVNMINVEGTHLSCVTARGHGLRETLFYSLFSRLQVYSTRADMERAVPCISDGAISLDGGIMKSAGVFFLGNSKDMEVRFPVSSGISNVPVDITETEEKIRLIEWDKERIFEDMQREEALLQHAKKNYDCKKEEFVSFLAEASPRVPQARTCRSGQEKVEAHVTDIDQNGRMSTPLLGFYSIARKRKGKVDVASLDESEESDYLESSFDDRNFMKKRRKKTLEGETSSLARITSDAIIRERGLAHVGPETEPLQKPSTLITPSVHTGFSFSIVHLLSSVRLAMTTLHSKDPLEVSNHFERSDGRPKLTKKKHSRKIEGINEVFISHENFNLNSSGNTGQKNFPSLTVREIVNRVRSNPGDACILETQEPLKDLVRGVLKILSSKTAPLGAKGWKALIFYEKSTKRWSWIGPVSSGSSDHDMAEEETSSAAWDVPHKMLVKLVDAFANWLKSDQETRQQIGNLPTPPMPNMNEKERCRVLRAQKNLTKISPSSDEVRAYFRREELLRYSVPDKTFSYTAADGKKSVVAPLRRCGGRTTSKARDHFMLKPDRPPHVTIHCIVKDAAARLPGGIGSRADVCTLIRDSQYIAEDVSDAKVNQVVSRALDRLHYERDPCVHFDGDRRLWVYLHRDRKRFRDLGAQKCLTKMSPSSERFRDLGAKKSLTEMSPSSERFRDLGAQKSLTKMSPSYERLRDLGAQKSVTKMSPSSDEVRAYFREEELLRYSVPDRAFSYTAADGKKSVVAPMRCDVKPVSKARDHFMLKPDRPPYVTILCIVRDAAARLPGSIGTRADVCTLVGDSQYIVEDVSDAEVNQVVSRALYRLHYEPDPCVHFDGKRKLWVYLHKDRQEEDWMMEPHPQRNGKGKGKMLQRNPASEL
ncbi:uncharacterized protein LOC143859983 [Tasmannia lanceolata]|uniref:uncharacterized protein LOC143859983 n=1 Tax=Tasmannia lanceolata TaxID=3420 RepID=UPI004064AE70